MMPCPQKHRSPLTLKRDNNESIETLLIRDRTAFIEYASSQVMQLKSDQTIVGTNIKSLQILTLPTRCYAVEFNDDFVTISLLE